MQRFAAILRGNWEALLLAAVFIALISINLSSPWQYVHDDNGALFSSCARTHLEKGFSVTKGQDFRMYRGKDELRPYLHHPPFVGLWLAGAFKMTGHDTPQVARGAIAVLQLVSFLLFWVMATRLCKTRMGRNVAATAFAVVPMCVFFGKMPNHEAPSLMFLMLGVLASLSLGYGWTERRKLAWLILVLSWGGVCFSSWAALFYVVGFVVAISMDKEFKGRRDFCLVSFSALVSFLALVLLQLAWARGWTGLAENSREVCDYLTSSAGKEDGVALWTRSMCDMFWHGYRDYSAAPWCIFLGFLISGIARWFRNEAQGRSRHVCMSLVVGTIVYAAIFPKAVGVHAYHLMYILPAVSLSCGLALESIRGNVRLGRMVVVVALAGLVTSCMSARRLHHLYSRQYEAAAVYAGKNISWQLKTFK